MGRADSVRSLVLAFLAHEDKQDLLVPPLVNDERTSVLKPRARGRCHGDAACVVRTDLVPDLHNPSVMGAACGITRVASSCRLFLQSRALVIKASVRRICEGCPT